MDSTKIALLVFISVLLGMFTLFIFEKPPVVEKLSGPSGEVNRTTSSFSWYGKDPNGRTVTYEYRKDGGFWRKFGERTRYIWTGYSEGEHTFEVRTRNVNGKSSEIISWNFSYQPNPLKSIDIDFPSGKIDISSITFEWESEIPVKDVQTFEFKKDDSEWANNGTSTNYIWNDYTVGKHTFKVRAKIGDGEYVTVKEWNFEYIKEPINGELVKVEAGTFMMGDTWGVGDENEKPAHKVTLTYDFYIGKHEVTSKEYNQFCNETGKALPYQYVWKNENPPILNINWWEAIAYCNWLSIKKGLPVAYDENGNFLDKNGNITADVSKVVGYRLPTEAEWEFAARGGNKSKGYKYAGSNNPGEVAWHYGNSRAAPHNIGVKKPNELNLYDMSGNVSEWCQDWYISDYSNIVNNVDPYISKIVDGSLRVIRGGYWNKQSFYIKVSSRDADTPTNTNMSYGFRICRTAE